jgi:Ribonuclease G/E
MENHKRAFRRWKQHVKFLRRLKNWIKPGGRQYYSGKMTDFKLITITREELIEKALKGECFNCFRTTGRPCNCDMCTYLKYERPSKGELNKQIWRDIED